MSKYLVSLDQNENPVWAGELVESSVNLVGPQEFIESYEPYFAEADRSGWGEHLKEKDPWLSFTDRSTYSDYRPSDDEKAFAAAKEAILSNNGVEKTVSWQTPTPS